MRFSPRNEDHFAFYVIAVLTVICFLVLVVVTPAHGQEVWEFDPPPPPTYEETTDWAYLVHTYFDPEDYDTAMSILNCESGGDPTADNPTSSARGGWQFLKSTWGWASAESGYAVDAYPQGADDPVQSTRLAAWLQDTYGFSQWSCYGVGARSWAPIVTHDLVSDGQQAR